MANAYVTLLAIITDPTVIVATRGANGATDEALAESSVSPAVVGLNSEA